MLHLASEQLHVRAAHHAATASAELMTIATLYRDDDQGFSRAKDLLSTLVGVDRAKCIEALKKRANHAKDNPLSDADFTLLLKDGSRNNRRPIPRNRSRSPRKTGRLPGAARGRQPARGTRPQENVENVRPPPNVSTANTTTRPATNPGRGRGRGSRSNSRNRGVLLFNRDNNNSRARSPSNFNPRSQNSLWSEETEYPRAQASRGRNYTLSRREQAFIDRFRNGDYDY